MILTTSVLNSMVAATIMRPPLFSYSIPVSYLVAVYALSILFLVYDPSYLPFTLASKSYRRGQSGMLGGGGK